ncbi:MAG: hypothetical protein ABIP65_03775 [Vicinamibacterales bacterium]
MRRGLHVAFADLVSLVHHGGKLPEDALGAADVRGFPFDDELFLAGPDLNAELRFQQFEVFVQRSEQRFGALFGQVNFPCRGGGMYGVLLFYSGILTLDPQAGGRSPGLDSLRSVCP